MVEAGGPRARRERMMANPQSAVILIGHGGVPRDLPAGWVQKLKQLEAQRKGRGGEPTEEERELDSRIRHWPRTPENDPYRQGLEALAAHLAPLLDGQRLVLAYNEFCAPSLEDAVEGLEKEGVRHITLVTTMITPGGSHADREIPRAVEALARRFPHLRLNYAWPFDLPRVAAMLKDQVSQAQR